MYCNGKALAGTGRWRSSLHEGLCPDCHEQAQAEVERRRKEFALYLRLLTLGGGQKPLREFRFDAFKIHPDNRTAFVRAQAFHPDRDNLYLWGPCGVGKTHLAFAITRRYVEEGYSVEFLKPSQLLRRVRRKDPDEEQQVIERFVRTELFVLDDLGIGQESAYARQIFQEILDGRDFSYRQGLVVTSKYSLDDFAAKLGEDTITSRLAGLCQVIHMVGEDARLRKRPNSAEPSR